MVLEVQLNVPKPSSEEFRRSVLAVAPREGEDCCAKCGVDRYHLVDALLDPCSWENRGMAAMLLEGCADCRAAVTGVLSASATP